MVPILFKKDLISP